MYQTILAAIDLTKVSAGFVLERAAAVLAPRGRLLVVHSVEPQYVQYSFDPTFTGSLTRELEQEALARASDRLEQICADYCATHTSPMPEQFVLLGRAADRIQDLAKEQAVDIIVIGSHNQHGWRRLLGSTANAVLHGAPVNVLVARLPEESK